MSLLYRITCWAAILCLMCALWIHKERPFDPTNEEIKFNMKNIHSEYLKPKKI